MGVRTRRSKEGSMILRGRTSTVILGRQDYVFVLLRLIGMELYKMRRRVMSKVLGSIAIAIPILVFFLVSLSTFFVLNAPADSFAPPCQSSGGPAPSGTSPNCPTPSAPQLAQARQSALRSTSNPLPLPISF